MSTHHTGVELRGLRSGILGGAFKPSIMERNGKKARSLGQAIVWIEELLRTGQSVTSSCPSPLADGSCPGHPTP